MEWKKNLFHNLGIQKEFSLDSRHYLGSLSQRDW